MNTVCDTKQLYDTEFEAELAANRHKDEMTHYLCPGTRHYHIAHVDRSKRQGHGFGWGKCPDCQRLFKNKTLKKHKLHCRKTLDDRTRIPQS